uniref:BTB_2 domain-containing protein n=1 Tax=Macrostomum lignano TaxID=282301 RepID=A0A1I8IU17_9PLAT
MRLIQNILLLICGLVLLGQLLDPVDAARGGGGRSGGRYGGGYSSRSMSYRSGGYRSIKYSGSVSNVVRSRFSGDKKYCCGPETAEYCCTFWDNPGRVAWVVVIIVTAAAKEFCVFFDFANLLACGPAVVWTSASMAVNPADTVTITVGGCNFVTRRATLYRFPNTRLYNQIAADELQKDSYFFDRDPEDWRAAPADEHLRPPFVRKELVFWGIHEASIGPCCLPHYVRYDEEKRTKKTRCSRTASRTSSPCSRWLDAVGECGDCATGCGCFWIIQLHRYRL